MLWNYIIDICVCIFAFYIVMARPIDSGVRPTCQNDSSDFCLVSEWSRVVK